MIHYEALGVDNVLGKHCATTQLNVNSNGMVNSSCELVHATYITILSYKKIMIFSLHMLDTINMLINCQCYFLLKISNVLLPSAHGIRCGSC